MYRKIAPSKRRKPPVKRSLIVVLKIPRPIDPQLRPQAKVAIAPAGPEALRDISDVWDNTLNVSGHLPYQDTLDDGCIGNWKFFDEFFENTGNRSIEETVSNPWSLPLSLPQPETATERFEEYYTPQYQQILDPYAVLLSSPFKEHTNYARNKAPTEFRNFDCWDDNYNSLMPLDDSMCIRCMCNGCKGAPNGPTAECLDSKTINPALVVKPDDIMTSEIGAVNESEVCETSPVAPKTRKRQRQRGQVTKKAETPLPPPVPIAPAPIENRRVNPLFFVNTFVHDPEKNGFN